MYTLIQRLNTVSAQATSIIITLLLMISATTFMIPRNLTSPSLSISNLKIYNGQLQNDYYDRTAKPMISSKFDLKADLTPLFNWNTKQVFLYLVADYSTTKYPNNRVVLYDRIIRSPKQAKINISGGKYKYLFNEISNSFKNVTATFSVHYDIMPHVGVLTRGEIARTEPIQFPSARV